MKIGFMSNGAHEDVDFAAEHGFASLELSFWPGPTEPRHPYHANKDHLRHLRDFGGRVLHVHRADRQAAPGGVRGVSD